MVNPNPKKLKTQTSHVTKSMGMSSQLSSPFNQKLKKKHFKLFLFHIPNDPLSKTII